MPPLLPVRRGTPSGEIGRGHARAPGARTRHRQQRDSFAQKRQASPTMMPKSALADDPRSFVLTPDPALVVTPIPGSALIDTG
jgi:hypothetical protein